MGNTVFVGYLLNKKQFYVEIVASERVVDQWIHITWAKVFITVAKPSSLLLKMESVCTNFIHHPICPLTAI